MNTEPKRYHMALSLLAIAGICLALAGCGSTKAAEPECVDSFDCAPGESCDVDRGVCGPSENPSTPECDGGDCDARDASDTQDAPDTSDTTSEPDADPIACDPLCADEETCTEGACVPDDPTVCNPACSVSEHCDNNVCVSNASNPNECRPLCADDETCYSGTCVSNNYPSCDEGCAVTEHCENGLCMPNASGGCNPACGQGEFCQAGECVPRDPGPDGQACTLWSSDSGCPSGEVCHFDRDYEGICKDSIDPTPTALGDPCSPDYDLCGVLEPDDNPSSEAFSIACFQVGADSFSCMMHCRLGQGDCDRLEGYGEHGIYISYECTDMNFFPRYSNVGVCSRTS